MTYKIAELNEVILKLITGEELPAKNRDHVLSGNYNGFRECHVTPDWLLIYSLDSSLKMVTLVESMMVVAVKVCERVRMKFIYAPI